MNRKTAWGVAISAWGLSACATLPQLAMKNKTLTPAEHLTLASAYMAHDEKNLAIQQYRAALEEDRRLVPALLGLGNIAYEDGQWDEAGSYFKRALKLKPDDPAATNNL